MVWGVCRRLLGQHDAEDAFQATFLVLVRKASSIVPRERVANWLYGVARQTARYTRRAVARKKAREKQVKEMPETAVRRQDHWRDLQPLLDQELSRLPDTCREAIVLCDLEGRTRKEVARQLGLPEGTVASRLARARKMLSKRLARHGLAVSGGAAVVLSQHTASASVPPSVLASTIKTTTVVAARRTATGVVSVKVAALAEGVLNTMFAKKIIGVAGLLLALGLLTAGGGVLTRQGLTAEAFKPRAARNAKQDKQDSLQKPSPGPSEPSRADRMKVLREAYIKARDQFSKDIQAGKIKADEDGKYPGWADVLEKYAKSARKLIDEDSRDAAACDALVFSIADLGSGGYAADPGLYALLLEHHEASEKIASVLASAPMDWLRTVAAKSPHANVRLWASYHLAEKLYADRKAKEAEPLLETVCRDDEAKKIGGYVMGSLADTAKRLLFEIRRLNVGQEVPEIAGKDLDGKPMKLSECRGKVTLLVFWATWCVPCMHMVPHEKALAERYADKPFAIVGVNGDTLAEQGFEIKGADGKVVDDTARVKEAVEKQKITWRSFRNGQFTLATDWNVRAWPTIFLIDHHGVIRGKWKGDPGEKELDAAVEEVVKQAEDAKDEK
jgi:RNA polymerase sigma factor (sigma-70 family)